MSASSLDIPGGDHTHSGSSEVLVERLFARIGEVSSLPAVAAKVIEVVNEPGAAAVDLLEVIEHDAALAARIVRTVNSSYYGLKNKVADLQLAITLLGFEHIRNLALTTYIAHLFENNVGHGSYRREGLWNHLIGVGTVAKLIANLCGGVPPREAYLAGLLHDLGLILVDQYLNKPFCQVIDALDEETSLCPVEREILGFTHAQLGAYVAEKWDMPENLIAAIRYHHEPERYQGPHQRIVCAVALGNLFCSLRGLTSLGVRNVQQPLASVFTSLGLGKRHVAAIWENLDETLRDADIMALAQSATRSQGTLRRGRSPGLRR